MYRLIALDLDDTLLGKDGQIGPENHAAIAAARAAGCEVTLVTARSWRATERFVAELNLSLPVICMTGAVTYERDGRPVQVIPLEEAAVRAFAATADAELWSARIYFADGRIFQSRPPEDFVPRGAGQYLATEYVGDLMPLVTSSDPTLLADALCQFVFMGHRSVEGALALLPELPETIATSYERGSDSSRTHLMHRTATKGGALARFCAARGIPPEAVIAMGDGEPDRSMIEWAGTGVAMGWASAGVRAAAQMVTDPSDPNPVATAVRRLLRV